MDLWRDVARLLDGVKSRIRVCKVPAHVEVSGLDDLVAELAALSNSDVDHAAGQAQLSRSVQTRLLWDEVRRSFVLKDLNARLVQILHRRVADFALRGRSEQTGALAPEIDNAVPSEGLSLGQLPVVWPSRLRHFGVPFITRLHAWLQGPSREACDAALWVSFVQLYVAFILDTGMIPPVYDRRTKRWVQRTSNEISIRCAKELRRY